MIVRVLHWMNLQRDDHQALCNGAGGSTENRSMKVASPCRNNT